MAKYQWTGAGETAGQAPTQFTNEWAGSLSEWEVQTDAEAETEGVSLVFVGTGNDRRRLALTSAGTSSGVVTSRSRFYYGGSGDGSLHNPAFGIAGSAGNETSMYVDVRADNDEPRISEYVDGDFGNLQEQGTAYTAAGWYKTKAVYRPGQTPGMEAVMWPEGDPEPDYALSVNTDVGHGLLGIGLFSEGTRHLDWITFGTDGDEADDLSADTTAPTYGTAPAIDSKTDTTVTSDATASDETDASVDHYAVILSDGAAAPDGDQIKAGTDGNDSAAVDSGSSTGVNNGTEASIQFTGLSASTAYDVYWVVEDSSGNQNVGSKLDVTTNAATATKGVSVTLYDRATQSIRASVTGIVARWWDSPTATGAPVSETATASTDSNGVLELDLDSDTGLDVGQNGYLVLYKEQADPESDWHFAARVAVEDIS